MADWEADEKRWSDWLAKAQHGDEEAYEALLTELAVVLRAYLIGRFGYLDILDDCVQECLVAIHQARHTYDAARPLRPWLFAIVRHRTIDLLRQTHRQERRPEISEGELDAIDFGEALDRGKLLGTLSKNLRDALVLTKLLGLSVRESAHRLGVSENVVKIRVHRGVRKLQAMWESETL